MTDRRRIAWELERTAMGDGYYGDALRAAKEFPADPVALPDGWVAVPREPTQEMVDRVIDFANEYYAHDLGQAMVYSLLRDVIDFAAAPAGEGMQRG